MASKRIALIDSDIVAYKAAAAYQELLDFGDFQHTSTDPASACRMADEKIEQYRVAVRADSVVVCLSDPDVNWRKQLNPTYKAVRKEVQKPAMLSLMKQYLYEHYRSYIRPRLEADDVMGILATRPSLLGNDLEAVIVSEDKDMRTIPGLVYNPGKADLGVLKITPIEAMQFHLWQTICGDTTDGYTGAPKVGPKSPYAEDALEITKPLEMWDNVLLAFSSVGLTEDDAIMQARMARILWADDYNFKTKGIRLWNPTCLFWR